MIKNDPSTYLTRSRLVAAVSSSAEPVPFERPDLWEIAMGRQMDIAHANDAYIDLRAARQDYDRMLAEEKVRILIERATPEHVHDFLAADGGWTRDSDQACEFASEAAAHAHARGCGLGESDYRVQAVYTLDEIEDGQIVDDDRYDEIERQPVRATPQAFTRLRLRRDGGTA